MPQVYNENVVDLIVSWRRPGGGGFHQPWPSFGLKKTMEKPIPFTGSSSLSWKNPEKQNNSMRNRICFSSWKNPGIIR
jgi:hypothetical protein